MLNICRILNMSEFWIFVTFRKYALRFSYGKVLNIPGFRVCQVSAYASVAQGSEYSWIWLNNALWQSSEYAWSTFHRVLSKPPVLYMPGLRIWQGCCEYARVTQSAKYAWKPGYALMGQYAWLRLNNDEYAWICQHITECWICQKYCECVWYST